MSTIIGAVQLPAVSAEFVKALNDAFRPMEIKPGFDRDELMKSVGNREVIDWIIAKALGGRTVTGEPSALRNTTPTGAIVRMGS